VANEVFGRLMKSQKGEAEVDLRRVSQTLGNTTFFRYKSYLYWPWIKPGASAGNNRLMHDTASCSRIYLEMLIVAHVVKKFPAFIKARISFPKLSLLLISKQCLTRTNLLP
jgi:hypothetical protein